MTNQIVFNDIIPAEAFSAPSRPLPPIRFVNFDQELGRLDRLERSQWGRGITSDCLDSIAYMAQVKAAFARRGDPFHTEFRGYNVPEVKQQWCLNPTTKVLEPVKASEVQSER